MARKPKTVNEEVIEEVELEAEIEETPAPKKAQRKTFDDHDYIKVHSVTPGGLHITCKSGNKYDFVAYGSELEMEYKDVVDLIRRRTSYVFLPRIIIDNDDVLEEFRQVRQLYESMYTDGDLKDILLMPANQIAGVIEQLPEGLIPNLRTLAATMVSNGEIDSLGTVRVLKDIFGADFDLLSELYANN